MCFKCMGRTSRYLHQPNPCALFYQKNTHPPLFLFVYFIFFVQVLWIILVAAAIFAIISAHCNRQTQNKDAKNFPAVHLLTCPG